MSPYTMVDGEARNLQGWAQMCHHTHTLHMTFAMGNTRRNDDSMFLGFGRKCSKGLHLKIIGVKLSYSPLQHDPQRRKPVLSDENQMRPCT
jgi:hypothetical protein